MPSFLSGWYGVDSQAQSSGAPFSYTYSNLTPGTTYYYVAWSEVGGVWYPGAVMSFTTSPIDYVTTGGVSNIGQTGATLNGTNGEYAAGGQSFWWGTSSSTFTSMIDPGGNELPSGWTPNTTMGNVTAGASFIPDNLTGLTPGTTYYYVAWSQVGGVWYPGSIESFTTSALDGDDTLSALGVSEGSLSPAFNPDTTSYTDTLPYFSGVPIVTATTADAAATSTITQATSTTGTATVAVTAQNGTTMQDYIVNFSLEPATSSIVNVIVNVNNAAGGSATSSDFKVTMFAFHPSTSTFSGSAAGTSVMIDSNEGFGVNISSLAHYTESFNGDCIDGTGIPAGNEATCTITETYKNFVNGPTISVGAGYGVGGNGGNGGDGQVLGASISGTDALQVQLQELQQQLVSLLQQYLTGLQTNLGHH